MYHCRRPEYRGDMVGRPADDEIGESDFSSESVPETKESTPTHRRKKIHYTKPPLGEGRILDRRKKHRFRVR